MPGRGDATRRRIIDAAYELFYASGFARAGVDAIAAAAGLTKRTLYVYFQSKDHLLAAVLEHQAELVLARLEGSTRPAADAATMMEILFADLKDWAGRPGWQGSGFSRAAAELADLPGHPARAAADRHKAAVERLFADRLIGYGVPRAAEVARELMLLVEGAMSLILIHGDVAYADAACAAARRLVAPRAAPLADALGSGTR